MAPLCLFFGAFVFAARADHVAGQQGFLSIDCGLDAKFSGRQNPSTEIDYVSDGPYVDGGENHRVAAKFDTTSATLDDLRTLRSFPSGLRNCYTLPTESGAKYLVRILVFHGNYDGKSTEFDLHLGSNYWHTVTIQNTTSESPWYYEAIFIAWASWVPVCLVNTGSGTPFVNTVELRPLGPSLYPDVTIDESMCTYARTNMGGNFTRFGDDPYDRYWGQSTTRSTWENLSTKKTIQLDNIFAVPIPVLQTAVAPVNNGTVLIVNAWESSRSSLEFKFILYFADMQNTQLRLFDIYLNTNKLFNNYSPTYLVADHVRSSEWYKATDSQYFLTLVASNTSMLPPMVNAYEIYYHILHDTPRTFSKD